MEKPHTETQLSLMDKHSITFDGQNYLLGSYRFANLENAVNYAESQPSKSPQEAKRSESKPEEKRKWVEQEVPTKSQGADYKFETAKNIGEFMALVGWLMVLGGSIAAIWLGLKAGNYGFALGAVIAICGLFQVAAGQLVQATVVMTNNTTSILHELQQLNKSNTK